MSLKFYLLSHVYSPFLHVVCLSYLTDSFYSLKLRYKRETQKTPPLKRSYINEYINEILCIHGQYTSQFLPPSLLLTLQNY